VKAVLWAAFLHFLCLWACGSGNPRRIILFFGKWRAAINEGRARCERQNVDMSAKQRARDAAGTRPRNGEDGAWGAAAWKRAIPALDCR